MYMASFIVGFEYRISTSFLDHSKHFFVAFASLIILLVQTKLAIHSYTLATVDLPCPQNCASQETLAPSEASPLVSIVTTRDVLSH